ncbi:conserved hypothetical protein [Culex quinquefasciatus]|uniref:Ninjurin a n=1 Tax=Culex quinquefasciatus TaxID=7176 RepID=B0WC28_CULQU|nr:conserved hypothetical protein [Culex quinquefasciatus]|eukprot:XP_001846262.1 conserved hypothetical protein [Culex quinquefasciatus]
MTKKEQTPLEMEPVVESALKAVVPAESDDPGLNEAKKPGLGKRLGKLVGQRATDVSLLTANSNQLRLMMHYNKHSSTYMICISLIIISLIVQKLVAAGSLAVKDFDQDVSYDLQFHKVIVKRAMDIAMLTANANQLRLLFTYNSQSQTFVACVTLVILSLLLQTSVAICLVIVKV